MDFLRLFQSIEELLYEVMSWLIFYPRTLWRSVRHPMEMLLYSERELRDPAEDQFTDMLSPPLFLLLTILLSHLIEIGSHSSLPKATSPIGQQIMTSDQNLLLLRFVLFSIYPLMFAARRLKAQGLPLDRETLRQPFFAQCYIAGPAALILGIAAILVRAQHPAVVLSGFAIALLGIAWYLRIETIWLHRHSHMTRSAAIRSVLGTWLAAAIFNGIASILIVGAP
ncbi:hypothetical protein HY78_25990 [Rhizorhabdus wittichii DC-6]|uniref:Permease n=2 Tax=Rhizorhabdus wittichii TaxID=160791 RepID=A0A9J9H8D7_RHIWR|nr:hypothetical protein [Rhizorhabdus wittichii]ABQ66788.1 hypothetical protein Swit_0420 [Rhizorhabdus wittichii RW1]ARR56641.1 hypothetical protein HY78_25990 [Rhizorhabdus wittichii DC-6]QTH22738.1 hypothetical protein HRJ34_04225 [Rhizorhabdus wittichii]